ncbi:MAG: MBL fold metallo-hydrolase, partial [Gammaproteobacteria bacterium]
AACAGALLLLLPRGSQARWSGLLLLAPLFLPRTPPLVEGGLRLQMLDVGQGLAVLVETRRHLLLYDTGPGLPGEWDLVSSVIEPALRRAGRHPDRVIVSHGDLDHAGGSERLRSLFPEALFLGNVPPGRPMLTRCDDRRYWRWDGVRFDVLHPSPWLPYLGNDSSCVVTVTAAGGSVLLPGDVSERVERRLATGPRSAYAAVVSPHHGSRTSTGAAFLSWARPAQVLVPAGVDNRFGFPHADVLERLNALQVPARSTADCGALTLDLAPDGKTTTRSARRQRPGWWRWPAGTECP